MTAEKVTAWFPIIARQWDSLQNFYNSIQNSCRDQLLDPQLSPATAVDAVAAALLLRGTDAVTVFREFLAVRREAVAAVATEGRQTSAREAMTQLLTIVITTLQCVHALFVEGMLKDKVCVLQLLLKY